MPSSCQNYGNEYNLQIHCFCYEEIYELVSHFSSRKKTIMQMMTKCNLHLDSVSQF